MEEVVVEEVVQVHPVVVPDLHPIVEDQAALESPLLAPLPLIIHITRHT